MTSRANMRQREPRVSDHDRESAPVGEMPGSSTSEGKASSRPQIRMIPGTRKKMKPIPTTIAKSSEQMMSRARSGVARRSASRAGSGRPR